LWTARIDSVRLPFPKLSRKYGRCVRNASDIDRQVLVLLGHAHDKYNLRTEDFVLNVTSLLRRLQLQWSLAYVLKTKCELLKFFS